MPRPCKFRRICSKPSCRGFIPESNTETGTAIVMSLDEYETLRIIDHENKTQQECAIQMNVARTTVTAIYERARSKLAACLVEARPLRIEGGDYELCRGGLKVCAGHCHHRHKCCKTSDNVRKKENSMKIAVAYVNGLIFQHFGKAENFKLYEIENDKVVSTSIIGNEGQGHGALVEVLKDKGVDTLICGGIGQGAQNMLADAGIKVYGGIQGDADTAVRKLLDSTLDYDPNVACSHHEHHDGSDSGCGSHGCGHHQS